MLRRLLDPILNAQGAWADPLGRFYQAVFGAIYRPIPPLKDFLHGTWLGHPLHPLLTDVPIGGLVVAFVLDLVGTRDAATWATGIGWIALVGTALAGFADYLDVDLDGPPRRLGSVHATFMTAAVVFYTLSLAARLGWLAIGGAVPLAAAGLVCIVIGGYVGGDLVFNMGLQVDRNAWRDTSADWAPLSVSEVPENAPTKASAGSETLVVVRRGERILALHDTCSHQGCSLAEGKLVGDDTIECGCHGSRFDLRSGGVSRGPAVFPQPVYEVRAADGKLEARRIH